MTSAWASTDCVGQAERDLRGNFDKGADRLIESLGSPNDDRALLLIHRR